MRVNIQYKDLFEKTMKQVLPELSIPRITGITIDSRTVVRGDIFLALNGENTVLGIHYWKYSNDKTIEQHGQFVLKCASCIINDKN